MTVYLRICNWSWYFVYRASQYNLFFFIFQLDTLFFRLRTISAILFPLHVSGLTGLSQRPHDKDICRGGEHHRLHVQFRHPDDGPVRPETCRGKRIADIVRRRKNSVSSWKIKKNKFATYVCRHQQQLNLLKTKRRLLYLKTQSVPRCKHFSSRL